MNKHEDPVPNLQVRPRLCVIVAGMHRSGTSAVARVVNLLGADIARELQPASPGINDRGFWESPSVMRIHDRLLLALGRAWDDPFPLPDGWLDTDFAREAQRELTDEINKDFSGSNLFVVKDPRIARLLPLWLRLLDDLAIEPVVVIPVRNPLEVSASLQKRNRLGLGKSLLIYVSNYLEVELASRGRRRLFVRHDRLLSEWQLFATKLRHLAGALLTMPGAEAANEIDDFLTPDLYRNRSSREALADMPDVAASIVELFDLLSNAANTGDQAVLRPSFDRLRETLAEATKLFHGIVTAERAEFKTALADRSAQLDAAHHQITGLQVALAAGHRQITGLETALAAADRQITGLDTALADRSAELAAAHSRIAETDAMIADRSTALAAANSRLAALATARDELSAELAAASNQTAQSAAAVAAQARELRAIRQSVSWQITKPLRWGRFLLRVPKLIWWTLTFQLRARRRDERQTRSNLLLIAASGLFDHDWYVASYPGVSGRGDHAILHYLQRGAAQGCDPNPLFDTDWYIDRNPDVRDAGMNPLVHYLQHGAAEGRDPGPRFAGKTYLDQRPYLRDARINPLAHHLQRGNMEGAPAAFRSAAGPPSRHINTATGIRKVWPLSGMLRDARRATRPFRRSIKSRLRKLMPGVDSATEATPLPATAFANDLSPRVNADLTSLSYLPTVSILVPVYNQSAGLLDRLVKSVQAQTYPRWELCFSDDGSTNPETIGFLRNSLPPDTGRINVFFSGENRGISNATNAALRLCAGDYISLLDHDDELTPDALWEVVSAINQDPRTDILYSDEDKVDSANVAYEPFHKPDWSPAFAMGVMYVGHLLTVRRRLALDVGGFDPRFDKVQDFEFLLRLSERTDRIKHIPKILYHWRSIPGSLAFGTDQKPDIVALQAAAVAAHLERLGIDAIATPHPTIDQRILLRPRPREHYPLISILIPTRDQPALLARCLESLFTKTTYPNLEVILIDNRTTAAEALGLFQKYPVKVISYQADFNFSSVNNIAAREAKGEYLVLLNNDTEVITPDWLEILLLHLELPDTAAVGPKLLYPDNSVQHAGIVLGLRGTADHIMRGFPADADGYFGSLACAREVSALTGACLMVRRNEYLRLGGLSEDYAVHYQDVDFCCRLLDKGRRMLFVPHATLYHHESASRGDHYDKLDRALLVDTFRNRIKSGDSFYNPNFVLDASASYKLRTSR